MHSLKRMLSSIVGSSATIKSTAAASSTRLTGHRSTDIPSSQYQYHHYHHQKVSIKVDQRNDDDNNDFNRDFFILTAHSIVFCNNAFEFESGARSAMFGCVSLYIIHLVTLWRFDIGKGLSTKMGSTV